VTVLFSPVFLPFSTAKLPGAEIEQLRIAVQQLINANADKDQQIEQLRCAVEIHHRQHSQPPPPPTPINTALARSTSNFRCAFLTSLF
jgi:hypothetical protein